VKIFRLVREKRRFRKKKALRRDYPFDVQRSRWLKIIFFAGFFILFLRAGTILLLPPSSDVLSGLAKRQYQRRIKLSPYRGPIFDRRGEPLAISIKRPSIFINPRVFDPETRQLYNLAKLLKMPVDRLYELKDRKSYFAWLKRKIDYETSQKVRNLGLKGLHEVTEPARYYPAGAAASQLIGYVGIDNNGLMGLELQYDDILSGDEAHAIRTKDAKGRIIFTTASAAAPEKSGQRMYLTIDRVVQEIAENALAGGIEQANAKSGFAIVSDPHTGRILALANYPPFKPNQRELKDLTVTRNKALLDVYEPGSVIKPLVAAKALAEGRTTLDEIHEVHNGIYREDRWSIRDSHPEEELTTAEILIRSSNIGIYKIAKLIGPKMLYETYRNFGIGRPDNLLGFPQQSKGRLMSWQDWRSIRFANIAFGQGLLVTGLEMVQAYGAIANGGHLMKPILVDRIESAGRLTRGPQVARTVRRTIPASTAKKMRQILQKVVEEGTGQNARLDSYTSAGKTGTSEKVDPETQTYADDLRLASFIGFAPVDDPHVVIYVVVDEPGIKPYYGGTWAAPVFRKIAEQTLHYLNVAPDRLENTDSPIAKTSSLDERSSE
jgi:cell division protein FtsI (penicillin-binding protein 3)